jgi:hypothetical protein
VDPDNRLVARGLETEWNTALQQLADAQAELTRRETTRPKTLTPQEKQAILALGDDPGKVWAAPTTTDKDRKQLLRTLLEEVNLTVHRHGSDPHADLVQGQAPSGGSPTASLDPDTSHAPAQHNRNPEKQQQQVPLTGTAPSWMTSYFGVAWPVEMAIGHRRSGPQRSADHDRRAPA